METGAGGVPMFAGRGAENSPDSGPAEGGSPGLVQAGQQADKYITFDSRVSSGVQLADT